MTAILLTIERKYTSKIINKTKTFELRKIKPKKEVAEVFVWEKRVGIIGYFKTKIHESEKTFFFDKFKNQLGVDENFFNKYFEKNENVIAYEVLELFLFKNAIRPIGLKPPQGFKYLSSNEVKELKNEPLQNN